MRARHGLWLGAFALALACRPPGPGDDSASGEPDTSAGESGEIPDPAFLNPAVGSFTVDSTQHVPEDIVVQRVVPGNTQLLVDDQSYGTLGPGSPFGELTADRLRLHLHGALTAGTHTLQLASSAPDGPRFSVKLTMVVEPPEAEPPAFRATLAPDLLGPGDRLFTTGAGPRALLGVVVAGAPPSLRIHLADETSWSATGVAVDLPGHVLENMTFGPAITAAALPAGDDGPTTVRLAYRAGWPGDALVARELTLTDPPTTTLEPVVDLTAELFDGAEYVALGRPFLAGDLLLAEFIAAGDTELPLPGDRGLLQVRRAGGGWSAPQRVVTPAPIDLDAVGPALDLLDLAADPPAFSVRVGRRLAAVLGFSPAGVPLLTLPPVARDIVATDLAVLTTLESDFGSRTVFVAARDRRPVAYFLGTSGQITPVAGEPAADALPDLPLAAPPAAAVLRGYSAVLLPYGAGAPVHLLLGDGAQVRAIALVDPEPLHCRAVALLATLRGNDEGAVPLACLGDDGLRLGLLTADLALPP